MILFILLLIPPTCWSFIDQNRASAGHGKTFPVNSKVQRMFIATQSTLVSRTRRGLNLVLQERRAQKCVKEKQIDDFEELCSLIGVTSNVGIHLDLSVSGTRGVFVSKPVSENDIILSVPLVSCLIDTKPADWFQSKVSEDEADPNSWASRLASSFIDLQLGTHENSAPGLDKWMSMLPDPSYLRASLPIHWPEALLQSTRCTALEMVVDSMFFARARTVQDLMQSMQEYSIGQSLSEEERKEICENALDIVQTRACRMVAVENWSPPIRLLVPVFDFINHETPAKAAFSVEDDVLIVRALCDLKENEEVTISYGESTSPSWKCLASYGFVPVEITEDDVADVFLNGRRFEVGATSVPEGLVVEMASNLDQKVAEGEHEAEFSSTVAYHLAQRLSNEAFYMLLERPGDIRDEEIHHEDHTAEQILSFRLAASLRWNQHKILMACATGLRNYAFEVHLD